MQKCGGVLNRKAARDIAHRSQERQSSRAVLNSLERDGGEANAAQTARELRQRGKMQVTEEEMISAQSIEVGFDRLLHLDDHLRLGEQIVRVRRNDDTDVAIILIRITTLLASAVLDEHFVSAAHHLPPGRGI